MTAKQNRYLFYLLGQLNISDPDMIGDMIFNVTGGRTSHKSEMEDYEYEKMIDNLKRLCGADESSCSPPTAQKMDKKRKQVIAAIFRYFELQNKTVTMDYVKAVACQAAGVKNFNKISYTALHRIYNEFCKKQRIVKLVNDGVKQDNSAEIPIAQYIFDKEYLKNLPIN